MLFLLWVFYYFGLNCGFSTDYFEWDLEVRHTLVTLDLGLDRKGMLRPRSEFSLDAWNTPEFAPMEFHFGKQSGNKSISYRFVFPFVILVLIPVVALMVEFVVSVVREKNRGASV